MIARKLDSDYTITKRMIRREARKIVLEAAPSLRNANFVRNYTYSGSGSGGFGGGGNAIDPGKTTAVVFDPANPGTTYVQTRAKIQGRHGVYMQDAPADDTINVVGDVVNDPLFWLVGV